MIMTLQNQTLALTHTYLLSWNQRQTQNMPGRLKGMYI